MNIKRLKKDEIEYIKQFYTEEEIIRATPKEVGSFLWLYFAGCMSLNEAKQRYNEIIKR